MALLKPIIHCLVDPEPTSFHAGDIKGETLTFAANLSFESPASQTAADEEKRKEELKNDETAARARLESMLHTLDQVQFRLYQLIAPAGEGAPYTLALTKEILTGTVSAPDMKSKDGHVLAWLDGQKRADQLRFWTSLEREFDPGLTEDAMEAGAGPRLRAAQAWNAPAGHRQGLTHLLRLQPWASGGGDGGGGADDDKIYVVLPYWDDPKDVVPTDVTVTPSSPKDWQQAIVECTYDVLGGLGSWRCRANPIGHAGGALIVPPPPAPPVDDALTAEGFLVVNKDADAIRRFLRTFEERAASILTAASALHVDGTEDAEAWEKHFGFKVIGPEAEPDKWEYHWGPAVWYVLSRLVASLDNHVLALLKPVADGKAWKPNPESEGDVLAPLVSAILAEMRDLELPGDFDGKRIAEAVRGVLQKHCPFIAGNTAPKNLLVPALRHVYGIAEPKTAEVKDKLVLDPDDAANLISSMLAHYGKGSDYDHVADEAKPTVLLLVTKSVAALASALIDLEQPLYDETGAERALIRLFETVELDIAKAGSPKLEERLTYRIAAAIAAGAPDGLLQTAVASGWAKYKAVLEGPFNGAEAMRRAVSASFAEALLNSVVKEKFTAERMRGLTAAARFYKWRLIGVMDDPNCFKTMALPLVRPDDTHRPKFVDVAERLDEAYARAVVPLVTPPNAAQRFTPDSFPQPLSIQIASGIDGSEIDDFAKAFNGICVVVRRLDDKDSKWAYANLADLRWGPKQEKEGEKPEAPKQASGVLHPMLPATADGRGPMFIDYEGFPFADTAGAERFNDDAAPGAQSLFYQHEPHEDYSVSTFEKLPRLAYGRNFQSFGFAVSNAGILPLALQSEAAQPWLPHVAIERLFGGSWKEPELFEIPYQRRTAIARMAVIETPASRRLGESIAGVYPLSADYPRLGIVAGKGLPGVIDLFKESDGAPRLHLPAKIERPIEWRLDELEWSGEPSVLTLRLFDHTPEAPGVAGKFPTPISGDLKAIRELRLVVRDEDNKRWLVIRSGETVHAEHALDQAAASYWLRLELERSEKKGDPASLSFASPEGRKPAGEDAPLILLQPGAPVWRSNLPSTITVDVSTPRVGYLDFMRWMANSTLRKEAYTSGADEFEKILLTAYLMRHLDARLAQQLDNLPDPVVDGIKVELLITDSLAGTAAAAASKDVDLRKRLGEFAGTTLPKIKADLEAWLKEEKLPLSPYWTPERLLTRFFKPLNEMFSFKIELLAGAAFKLGDGLKAEVPSGCVAQLGLHAEVRAGHFDSQDGRPPLVHPAVFHKGLKQFASRKTGDGTLLYYPAGAICIETMHDGIEAKAVDTWIKAAEAMIEAVPVANTRCFDIKTHASVVKLIDKQPAELRVKRDLWRLLGEVDVTTQRWRVSGRPIYNFIRPRDHALDKKAAGPALPITAGESDDKVEQFESEAFFDRPNIDAQTVTQRLAPLGTRTLLQQHSWDAPSATYFRHRFTLRSRYAGALQLQTRCSVDAWAAKPQRKEEGWTMRVAMLADASRLILTRPQLRALIPLTTAPGGESAAAPVPPVAAILQEPPYSRGGLADRIAPEIRTGFGYGFEEPKKGDEEKIIPVEIRDSRKEIGPNPQLDYRAFDGNMVLGLSLRGEGPIGMTFDMPDAPAPAFANTMLSLRPLSLTNAQPPLEEALMGVAMRRYLDPAWLAGPQQSDTRLQADRTWWIEPGEPAKWTEEAVTLSLLPQGGSRLEIMQVKADPDDGDYFIVSARKGAIDKVEGYKDKDVTIARVRHEHARALAILNQPIAPGRYSTSILATLQSVRVADGEGGLPMMLASFEWSGPERPKNEDGKEKPPEDPAYLVVSGAECKVRETMASATTSLRWVQASRDFDFVRVMGRDTGDDPPLGKPLLARNLVAKVDADKITFDLIKGRTNVAIGASTLGNPYPVHVHRHTGFITTRYLSELGRPVEVFCRRALAGGQVTVLPGDPGGGEQAVRVIEFETPASIICDNALTAVPEAYKMGYFDLVSTGYQKKGDIVLTIRFVGSAEHLANFKKLTVLLIQPGKKVPIEIDLPKKTPVIGARLILRPSAGKKEVWLEAWTMHDDGAQRKVLDAKGETPLDFSMSYPGFWLEFSTANVASGGLDEFWADVSLLHCAEAAIPKSATVAAATKPPPGPAVAFDFGWLFSPLPGEPAALVVPAELARMTEAQARIISVSPPIPIA